MAFQVECSNDFDRIQLGLPGTVTIASNPGSRSVPDFVSQLWPKRSSSADTTNI